MKPSESYAEFKSLVADSTYHPFVVFVHVTVGSGQDKTYFMWND
ncbi:BQ2448_6671 [Microbotryum intermedium]|uniref:BQ2448_6671 protein n=1 Tax=Microbotryum intermedium TaxID=269621 RepID=A0A238FN69_9BASI|nr:BQ2448_6671 [Microbotryum intermedium]